MFRLAAVALCTIVLGGCTAKQPDTIEDEGAGASTVQQDTAAVSQTASAGDTAREEIDLPPSPESEAMQYTRYRNEDYNYSLVYPAAVMAPQDTIGANRGREFTARDGNAGLVVFAAEGASQKTLQKQYREQVQDQKSEITYNVLRDNWFVVSGWRGGDVFYQRTRLEGDTLKTFRVRYNKARKEYYDPITAAISRSFQG